MDVTGNKSLDFACVEPQICQAFHIKKHALATTGKTNKHMLALGASRHDAWTSDIQVSFGEASYGAAVGATPLRRSNVHSKYSAQFAGGSVAVKVVVFI
jgi:hypothetical protein